MKKITLAKANQNFSQATRMADEEGAITITRHDKDAYVLMTKERYLDTMFINEIKLRLKEGIWGHDEKGLVYMEEYKGIFKATILELEENKATGLITVGAPFERVEFLSHSPLEIRIPRGENTGEEIISTVGIEKGTEKWDDLQKMFKAPEIIEEIKITIPHEC